MGPEARRPLFKLYEHVSGALLAGEARPDAQVQVKLALETNQGRRIEWVARTTANRAGRWRQRVPYATQGAPPAVRPEPTYRVSSRGVEHAIVVPEDAVQRGDRIDVPPLRMER